MRARLPALAAATLAVLTLPSGAEPPREPQVVDARGDARDREAAHDVVSATFDTSKRVTVRYVGNRRTTTVTPVDLVVTLELAAQPAVSPGTSYQVAADTAACGSLFAYVHWDAKRREPVSNVETVRCGASPESGALLKHTAYLTGTGIVWRVPLASMPRQLRVGERLYDLQAYTSSADPVTGYTPADFVPAKLDPLVSYDSAASPEDYLLGS